MLGRRNDRIGPMFDAAHESGIGTFRTCQIYRTMSAFEGGTDIPLLPGDFRG